MKDLDLHKNWKSISTAVLIALGGMGAGALSNTHSASAHTISPKNNTMRMTKARHNKRTKLASVNKLNQLKRNKANKTNKVNRVNKTKQRAPRMRQMKMRRTSKKIFGIKKQSRKPKATMQVKQNVHKANKSIKQPVRKVAHINTHMTKNSNNQKIMSSQLNQITQAVNKKASPRVNHRRIRVNGARQGRRVTHRAQNNYVGLNVKITSKRARKAIKRFFDPSFAHTKVAKILASKLGDPYQWGGNGPHRFDCSGLMKYVMKHGANINIPRTAPAQYQAGRKINSWKSLKAGDLLFFGASRRAISHVGMYIGRGNMIDAQNSGVTLESPRNSWWHLVSSSRVRGFSYPKFTQRVENSTSNALAQASSPQFTAQNSNH